MKDAAADGDGGARESDSGGPNAQPIAWQSTSASIGSGSGTGAGTGTLTFSLPGESHVLAVRSFAEDAAVSGKLCLQLEDVTIDGDQRWVGASSTADYGDYCIDCAQRVSVGTGYGFYVLPSGADDAPPLTSLALRVMLRDCVTLTPLDDSAPRPEQLTVEVTSWDPPPSAASLQLAVSVVVATPYAFDATGTLLHDALANLQRIWRVAHIELQVAEPVTIDRPEAPVVYSAVDHSALTALARAARAAVAAAAAHPASPIVIIAPCLRRDDVISGGRSEPLSTTPHIPGGFAVADEADTIFVAGERCEGLDPGASFIDSGTLGAVIAHELGHYLGLYHVEEVDGRQDSLIDTSPDQPNLMQAMPTAQSVALSNSQIVIARRHPAFVMISVPPP